ncbi:hypothetical protein [Caulobacter sp. NIBR2454]|uniref:hypothetical protein n=1 Tax=Caulobacter sp. NIBR2454 TaxID=3015996 RepID=UPI0022B60D0F|nr:hypothetical protein [Caulobacter sp. NIBR2454]
MQKTASTSRVLNLPAVETQSSARPEYSESPMFRSRILNTALIIKHRLRPDDSYLFDDARATATKIIIPFERSDLGLGGQSLFVGQRGWADILREACRDVADIAPDLRVLRLIDSLPSLDPFLLRENLRRHGHRVAPCYFAISQADMEQMQHFVGDQIAELTRMAYREGKTTGNESTNLVKALLSTDVDERLEPLRQTLVLEGESFREGVFSWKGVLYYKWMFSVLEPQLRQVVRELGELVASRVPDPDTAIHIDTMRKRLQRAILLQKRDVKRTLEVYDDAFRDLTINGKAQAFRAFLLSAPDLFLSLGEKIGAISHISSFWRYRFPQGRPPVAPVDEVYDILNDFEASLQRHEA